MIACRYVVMEPTPIHKPLSDEASRAGRHAPGKQEGSPGGSLTGRCAWSRAMTFHAVGQMAMVRYIGIWIKCLYLIQGMLSAFYGNPHFPAP